MTLKELNAIAYEEAIAVFLKCCGSYEWTQRMALRRPFESIDQLRSVSDEIWFSLTEEDWKEAFSHHPKIGDIENLRERFKNAAQWSSREQAGVAGASEETLQELAEVNSQYEQKFGYIFIVFATGKSAREMLAIARNRLNNPPDIEILIAAQEQAKITKLRLGKALKNG